MSEVATTDIGKLMRMPTPQNDIPVFSLFIICPHVNDFKPFNKALLQIVNMAVHSPLSPTVIYATVSIYNTSLQLFDL